MEESYKCTKESTFSDIVADIRVLTKTTSDNEKKIDKLKDKCELMNEINTSIQILAITNQNMVEHSRNQDEAMKDITKTLESVNSNLRELSEGQRTLNQEQKNTNNKVAKLQERVDENERRSTINVMDLHKEDKMNVLRKYGYSMGAGAALLATILQIVKIIKG